MALRLAGCHRPTDLTVREGGRVVSVAAIIATGVNQDGRPDGRPDGRREILGLGLGPSEAATFWIECLRALVRRGLTGVKLVISDAHEGLKTALCQVLNAPWQRCRVHFLRSLLALGPKGQHTMVSAAIRQVFVQPDRKTAGEVWRHVADQLRPRFAKLAARIDEAEFDVLAYRDFPEPHRAKRHSTNPLERLNTEVKRRTDVVGIFPTEASLRRLVGAVLLEQNDEWQLQHRYLTLETMVGVTPIEEPPAPARLHTNTA